MEAKDRYFIDDERIKKLVKVEEEKGTNGSEYLSEKDIEERFINSLIEEGYEYSKIKNEDQLIRNLREKIEILNSRRIKNFRFTNSEWETFFNNSIVGRGESLEDKTEKIQGKGYKKSLKREDGTVENILLIDKENLNNNQFQVINQYYDKDERYRYDVTILVNGLPLIHIELKRPDKDLKTAFNQIRRYKEKSFISSNGLFDFVQIFIISNGVSTKYYPNTTRNSHVNFITSPYDTKTIKSSHSFEFTSWWADAKNKRITDLIDFSKSFLRKKNIIKVLTKYCVFDVNRELKILRPYQIFAIKAIIEKIKETINDEDRRDRGGYIWHTTGSGKTLTSFKAAQLIKEEIPEVEKVIFVVDRKDLNYKTEMDYNNYERGSANGTRNYKQLEELLNPKRKTKIIITTIQKLNHYVKKHGENSKFKPKTVLLIDECHRSHGGHMNERIFKFFSNANIFGFTGTPIKNADGKTNKNTKDQFGEEIHRYTIINAIDDKNVVVFWINEVNSGILKDDVDVKSKEGNPLRIKKNVEYILKNFDKKTHRNEYRRNAGFNSIFATSSIPMAQKYYIEFLDQLKKSGRDLKISIIYSYTADSDENVNIDETISENGIFLDNDKLDVNSKRVLQMAMDEHNETFKTNFKLDKNFDDYYKSISQKLKDNLIDMLIVVNMFLTGFDAQALNTLWVDKNLKMHNLIQALSRTNRIFNSKKKFGNIVSFRPIQDNLDEAIYHLFGDSDEVKKKMLINENFDEIYEEYKRFCEDFMKKFPHCKEIIGNNNIAEFINDFGKLLRMKNKLMVCEEYSKDKEVIGGREFQIYKNWYSDFLRDIEDENNEILVSSTNIEYEPELIKSFMVDIDYIVNICREYMKKTEEEKKRITDDIMPQISSSNELQDKKDIFEEFFRDSKVHWDKYIEERKNKELISMCEEADLKVEETKELINKHTYDIEQIEIGKDIDRIFKTPISRRNPELRREKIRFAIEKIKEYFERFEGL